MKICQVNPGCGIEIPPKGWGAIEKIVWEFTTNLRKQGHEVDIKWTNEVGKGEYDMVHVHVANLALNLAEKGIPYIFQCHDHHAFHWGKDSFVFKQNLEAIEKSELSILPAKYLVDYFGSDKAVYFSHGVDTNFFTPNLEDKPHKLLMVANNGLGGKDGHDRKGFTEGIKAASKINLPITIAGPENNKNFIKDNPWVEEYDVNWVFNPNQDELLSLYQDHTIFLHPSELEAGHPNLTILEAMSCGLPVVGCMEDNLDGMAKVEKNVESVREGIQKVLENYKEFKSQSLITAEKLSWYNRSKELTKLLKPQTMKEVLVKEYNNLQKNPISPLSIKNDIFINFVKGAKVEIKGKKESKYHVQFIDKESNKLIHQSTINNNMWTKTNIEYFVDYKILIKDLESGITTEHYFDAKDKKVYIHLASKSLGDTIAWLPYAEEFRKKHNCKLVVSTFNNDMFEENYPEIEFVSPGTKVFGLYAMYEVGWHYDKNGEVNKHKNKSNFREISLQRASSETLGLENNEIKPKLTYKNTGSTIDGKYVCIAPHASALSKYWNYPGGWQAIVDYLNELGYKVVMITKEPLNDDWHDSKLGGTLTGVIDKTGDFPLSERANDLLNAEAFIGVGSGLSWLSWALNTPTIMISGFSEPYTEFEDCERIEAPEGKCRGCFNRVKLDPGDWRWCPDHKDTDRMFECTTSIPPSTVINSINKILNKS